MGAVDLFDEEEPAKKGRGNPEEDARPVVVVVVVVVEPVVDGAAVTDPGPGPGPRRCSVSWW